VLDALHSFGLNTGIAFQIFDDVLDYTGDPAEMGKNVGDDLSEGKPTLPLIHLLSHGTSAEQALVRRAISERTSADIDAIITAVNERGSLTYAEQVAARYQEQALASLQALPDNASRAAMAEIARLATRRKN